MGKRYWCVSVTQDSCDSGCEDPVYDTYFTSRNRANEFFENALDDMVDNSGILQVDLEEYEDVNGKIEYYETLRSFYSYGRSDSYIATIQVHDKEMKTNTNRFISATRISDIYERYSPGDRYVMNINGSVVARNMMSWRIRDLADKNMIGANASEKGLFIAFVPMCRGEGF